MQKSRSFCGTCSICLSAITPETEAFLDQCFHQFCYKCIKEWTHTQRLHPPQTGPRFTCPLCKQPYYSIIFDWHESAFRREQVASPPRGVFRVPSTPRTAFSQLASAHRRRRSVYYSSAGGAQAEATPHALLGPHLISRNDVARWVERELQALMWQDDVALVAQHVLGTLRSAAQTATKASRAAGRSTQPAAAATGTPEPFVGRPNSNAVQDAVLAPGGIRKRKALALGVLRSAQANANLPTAEEVAAAVARAAVPYIFEHAERFGWELVSFVASGLTLEASDKELWAQHPHPSAVLGVEGAEDTTVSGNGSRSNRETTGEAATSSEALGAESGSSGGPGARAEWPAVATSRQGGGGRNFISEPDRNGGSSGEGNHASSRDESSGGFGGGALARSDSEGYLELMLAQGRRHRTGGATLDSGGGGEVGAAGVAGGTTAVAEPASEAELVGPRSAGATADAGREENSAPAEGRQERRASADGHDGLGSDAGKRSRRPQVSDRDLNSNGDAAEQGIRNDLEVYRRRALQSMSKYRRAGDDDPSRRQ